MLIYQTHDQSSRVKNLNGHLVLKETGLLRQSSDVRTRICQQERKLERIERIENMSGKYK